MDTRARINKMKEVRATALMCTPTYGLRMAEVDKEGGDLFEPGIDYFLVDTLKRLLPPEVSLKEVECHISDPKFAQLAVEGRDEMISSHWTQLNGIAGI